MAERVLLGEELMFPSDYLAAEEFRGRDVTLTISAVGKDEVFVKKANKSAKKPVLRFKETTKKLICNKTNGDSIAAMYGRQAREWVGKRITLFPTTCQVGKKKDEPCIRVRERVPGPPGSQAQSSAPAVPLSEPEPPPPSEPDAFGAEMAALMDAEKAGAAQVTK